MAQIKRTQEPIDAFLQAAGSYLSPDEGSVLRALFGGGPETTAGIAAPMALPEARVILSELAPNKGTSLLSQVLREYPEGTQLRLPKGSLTPGGGITESDRVYIAPRIGKRPESLTEQDIISTLGRYSRNYPDDPYHYGFFTPKGEAVGLGGASTHRDALEELLNIGFRPEEFGVDNWNLFTDNPFKPQMTYDIPEMLNDTKLARSFIANRPQRSSSYLHIPPNATDETIDAMARKVGKRQGTSADLAIPDAIKYLLDTPQGGGYKYDRYYIKDLFDEKKPFDRLIGDMIGRYAEDVAPHIRRKVRR